MSKGSQGAPSTAATRISNPSFRNRIMRAFAALIKRNRTDPSGNFGWDRPFTVRKFPCRPHGTNRAGSPDWQYGFAPPHQEASHQQAKRCHPFRFAILLLHDERTVWASGNLFPCLIYGRDTKVPASRRGKRYVKLSPGSTASWVRPGHHPSHLYF